MGVVIYDMGGILMGEVFKVIDDFKCSFGGELVWEFNCVEVVSMCGWVVLMFLVIKDWLCCLNGVLFV